MRAFSTWLALILLSTSSFCFAQATNEAEKAGLVSALERVTALHAEMTGSETALNTAEGEQLEELILQHREKNQRLISALQVFATLTSDYLAKGGNPGDLPQSTANDLLRAGADIRAAVDAYALRLDKNNASRDTQTRAGLKGYQLDNQLIDLGFTTLSSFVTAVESMQHDASASVNYLKAKLPERIDNIASRLRLSNERKADSKKQVSATPGDAALQELQTLVDEKLAMEAASMQTTIELATLYGIDTREFQTLLLRTTGQLSTDILDTTILGSLFSDWWVEARQVVRANAIGFTFKLAVFGIILLVFHIFSRLVRNVIRRSLQSSRVQVSKLLEEMLISLSGKTIFLLGVLVGLSQLGISLGPVLAGLGVAGFVLGFALQDSLSNFAAGLMILFYRPFDVGDVIDAGGAFGTVRSMSIVSTAILTFDNQTLIVPNNKIWGGVIKNVTAQSARRVDMTFGISYRDNIEKVEAILHDIVAKHEKVLADPAPLIKLHNLGESSVDFIVRPWSKTADYWDVYWDITRAVKLRFDAEGISIPFPQHDVHVHQLPATISAEKMPKLSTQGVKE